MARQPLPKPLITRPATKAITLFATVEMIIPRVKIADPIKIVFFRPNLSAKSAPVKREPANAPAWIEAVMPPCKKLLGEFMYERNWGIASIPLNDPVSWGSQSEFDQHSFYSIGG